ncbi:unnamed protein product [Prorocentrum cordatum]|uniref:Uncharacterized protein n=1 Tax=Prorocentrum cordatum TaxID=2364126 RepID=A0ABN9SM78_9DINO|nr:unnamed protein product [Polarella glacialis]
MGLPSCTNIYVEGDFQDVIFCEFGNAEDRDTAVAQVRSASLKTNGYTNPCAVEVGGERALAVTIDGNTIRRELGEDWGTWAEMHDHPEFKKLLDSCDGIVQRATKWMKRGRLPRQTPSHEPQARPGDAPRARAGGYYLTDPSEEWAPSEGGALELYAPQPGAPPGTPATAPAKEILPLADALVLFVVEPGVSFHSVREVRGKRARVSIQGWLHAPALDLTRGFANRGLATLAQLVQGRTARAAEPQPPRAEPAMAAPAPAGPPVAPEAEEWGLTAEDTAALSEWVAPEYLSAAHLEAIAERFAEASYAVLSGFLRPDVFERLSALHAAVDAADGFGAGRPEPAAPPYGAGAAGGWRAVGPPHLRRHLRYDGGAATPEQGGGGGDGPHRQLGAAMQRVASGLLGSTAFRRWLHACTRLEPRPCGAAEVRRFRPGLDYTVAVCPPAEAGGAELDATLVFVEGGASQGQRRSEEGEEDLGGFESYLAADDEEETAQAQEVYRGSDEGPLVNLPAAANSLCLVMRDPGTLRFVKFLSRDAPSSRADVAGCFSVDMPEESDPEPAAAVERPAGPP